MGSPYELDQHNTGGGRSLKLSLSFESKLWRRRIHTGVILIGKACPGPAQEPRKRRYTNQEQKRGSLVMGKRKRKKTTTKKQKPPPRSGLVLQTNIIPTSRVTHVSTIHCASLRSTVLYRYSSRDDPVTVFYGILLPSLFSSPSLSFHRAHRMREKQDESFTYTYEWCWSEEGDIPAK